MISHTAQPPSTHKTGSGPVAEARQKGEDVAQNFIGEGQGEVMRHVERHNGLAWVSFRRRHWCYVCCPCGHGFI